MANFKQKINYMEKVKVFAGFSMGEIQIWINRQKGLIYESIKINTHEVNSSPSGVIFTITALCIG